MVVGELGCPECFAMFHAGFTRCPFDAAPLESGVHDRLLGHILNGRYILQELVGVGSVGRVYKARHVRLERIYAIKILFGELAADPKARTRFLREATAASRLLHPNLLSVLDVGETERGLVYMVMDFVAGEDLHQVLAREAPLPRRRAVDLLRQIARGLGYAHERGVIHRDLKCENVMISRSGEGDVARVVDFGIALTQEALEPGQRLTTAGTVLGTPAYMSPEQLCGEEIDQRSDLYALGVILYRMLCGRFPFDGTPLEMATANLNAVPPRLAERVPGLEVDPGLEEVTLRLLAKDPAGRFDSARAVLDALDSQAGGRAVRRDPRGSRQPPPVRASLPLGYADTAAVPTTSPTPVATAPAAEPTEKIARRRTTHLVGAAAVVAVAAIWIAGGRDAAPRRAAAPPVDSAPLAVPGRRIAAPEPPAPPPAALSTAAPPIAEPPPPPVRDRPVRKPPAARPRAAAPVSAEAFRQQYVRVGKRLGDLAERRGESAVDPLRRRYFAIPFADSLRSEPIRRDAALALRQLAGAIDRELR